MQSLSMLSRHARAFLSSVAADYKLDFLISCDAYHRQRPHRALIGNFEFRASSATSEIGERCRSVARQQGSLNQFAYQVQIIELDVSAFGDRANET